jgi:hypothetical protein
VKQLGRSGKSAMVIMYLASYLRHHGIIAYCQFNDPYDEYAALEQNVRQLLRTARAKIGACRSKVVPVYARSLKEA